MVFFIKIDLFINSDSFRIAYHVSPLNVQTNYCNNDLLILDVKQLNKIMKLYYFYTLKVLSDGQGKIKVYYGMPRVKTQLSGKRSISLAYQNKKQTQVFILSIFHQRYQQLFRDILQFNLKKSFEKHSDLDTWTWISFIVFWVWT